MKKFPFKLDEWIEEDIEVTVIRPKLDRGGRLKLTPVVEKRKQRTFYTKGVVKKLSCKDDEHYFVPLDKKSGIVHCLHCTLHRKIYPVTHDLRDGKIVLRD